MKFMLKHIPAILPPELVKILMEMGHGDELVLADGNFPSANVGTRVVRCDGHGVSELLDAILTLMPLDTYVEAPITLMAVAEGDPYEPVIWNEFQKIAMCHEPNACQIQYDERFAFYDHARKAYAVVATGETALYANIILKKGVVVPK